MGSPFTIDPTTGQPGGTAAKKKPVTPANPFTPTADAAATRQTADPFSDLLAPAAPVAESGYPVPPPATVTTLGQPAGTTPAPTSPPNAGVPPPSGTPPVTAPVVPSTKGNTPPGTGTDLKSVLGNYLLGNEDPQAIIDRINTSFPQFAGQAAYYPGNNTIGLPTGYFSKDGGTTWNWHDRTGGTGGGTGAPSAVNPANIPADVAAMDPALHEAIVKLLAQGNTPVSADDPLIASQVQAYRQQQDLARQQGRQANAEAAAYEGTPTSTFDTQNQRAFETEGQNIGGFQANLIGNELKARRQQVVEAIQFAQGADAQALQLELANIDETLKNQQFYDQLGVGVGLDQAKLNAAIKAALGA